MGNFIKETLIKYGVSQNSLKKVFVSYSDFIIKAIEEGDLKLIK